MTVIGGTGFLLFAPLLIAHEPIIVLLRQSVTWAAVVGVVAMIKFAVTMIMHYFVRKPWPIAQYEACHGNHHE